MDKTPSSSGIGFTGLLFLVFLVLKLTHVIAWSWLWVAAPLWGGLALWLGVTLIILVVGLVGILLQSRSQRPRR